ncbi:unnamed protein product [Urochloa humidicola]
MASQPGDDRVKLETMISREATSSGEFAVLVQVTAPSALPTEHPDSAGVARGVDLVAVLDISASMNQENRLERMKDGMFTVLDQLRPDDRLCILSFNDEVQTLTELSFMSDENWATARAMVQELTALAEGGANVKAATEAAATILAKRGEEEQRDRVGRVVFLTSGGEEDTVADDPGLQKQNDATSSSTSHDLAPDAFVLGADNKLRALSFSAGNTSAAYSCVDEDVNKIMDAPGLMSVDAAMGVQVELHAQEGVAISSMESGGCSVRVGPDGPRSLTIYVQDLYAGEQKSFTAYVAAPEGKEELLAVTGWYRDAGSGEDVQLDVCEVSVPPPIAAAPVDEAVDPQVQDVMDRNEKKKETATSQKKQEKTDVQEHKKNTIPDEKRDMPGTPASVPEQVVIIPGELTVSDTSLFMLVSASLLGMIFAVRNLLFWAWGSVAKQAKTLKKEERKFRKVKVMWVWARNNPYPPCAVMLLVLGAAMLLVARKLEHSEKSSRLGVPHHLSWPQMEDSFDLVMLKEMENAGAGITSCFNCASVADMCPSINKYMYQAIVHGRGVHVPLLGQTGQKAEMEKSMAASGEEKNDVVLHANTIAYFQDLRGEC